MARALGDELIRERQRMKFRTRRAFQDGRPGGLSTQQIGRLERGDGWPFETRTIAGAEVMWGLRRGAIMDFLEGHTSRLEREVDPFRDMDPGELEAAARVLNQVAELKRAAG
jgi:hypothetical protein